MSALFAVVSTCKSNDPTIQNQEIKDTQHTHSVSTHTDCSSTLTQSKVQTIKWFCGLYDGCNDQRAY